MRRFLAARDSSQSESRPEKIFDRENRLRSSSDNNMAVLRIFAGVDTVEIDSTMNKVTVIGYIDRTTVLRAVRRAGKRAEFWQDAFNYYNGSGLDHQLLHPRCLADLDPDPDSSAVASSPYFQHHAFRRSYNYEKHGYNHRVGSDGSPRYDPASTLFSDENANAYCSIM
jgi:hypothetical protein